MSVFINQPKSSTTNPARSFRPNKSDSDKAWAIVLAGGEGLPRRTLIPASLRRARPRHFCRTPGQDIIISETKRQVALAFAPENTIFAVTEDHLGYCEELLEDVPRANLIVEPQDDGTLFAVFYSLLRLKRLEPDALVAFFPAELGVSDSENFMKHVAAALDAVRREPKLVLLGIEPETPDENREWIEPDFSLPIDENSKLWGVRSFRDRISADEARQLMKRGGLWNSRVMVGTISTFLRKIRRAAPEIYAKFIAAESKIGTPGESFAMRRIYYGNYADADFSRDVLAKSADKLAVIPVGVSKRRGIGLKPRAVKRSMPEAAHSAVKSMTAAAGGF